MGQCLPPHQRSREPGRSHRHGGGHRAPYGEYSVEVTWKFAFALDFRKIAERCINGRQSSLQIGIALMKSTFWLVATVVQVFTIAFLSDFAQAQSCSGERAMTRTTNVQWDKPL